MNNMNNIKVLDILNFGVINEAIIAISPNDIRSMLRKNEKKQFDYILNELFNKPISEIFNNSSSCKILQPYFELKYDETSKKKKIFFSKSDLLIKLSQAINEDTYYFLKLCSKEDDYIDTDEMIIVIKQEIKNKIINYKKFISGEDAVLNKREKEELKIELNSLKSRKGYVIPLNEYLKYKIDALLTWRKNISSLLYFYDKPIDEERMLGMYDSQSLFFYIAYLYLVFNIEYHNSTGEFHECLEYPINFKTFIDKQIEKDKNFNLAISGEFKFGNKKLFNITYLDFLKLYDQIICKVPKDKMFTSSRSMEGLSVEEASQARLDEYIKSRSKELSVDWELIKTGTTDDHINKTRSSSIFNEKHYTTNDEYQKREEDIQKRLNTLQTDTVYYKIQGINKFEGYIGFIYSNGLVVFEKFYENKKPCINNATYVMDIKEFVYFSSLSKPEIIDFIKDHGNDKVKRVFHTIHWDKNIIREIHKKGYDRDTLFEIDQIIDSNNLSRKIGDNHE